jgi:hypothetical protein
MRTVFAAMHESGGGAKADEPWTILRCLQLASERTSAQEDRAPLGRAGTRPGAAGACHASWASRPG